MVLDLGEQKRPPVIERLKIFPEEDLLLFRSRKREAAE
jgi:hypothetical protein